MKECEERLCLLLGRDIYDERGVIVELRRRTQSEASGEFTNCLSQMLRGYSAMHGWRCTVLQELTGSNPDDLHILTLEISAPFVYGELKYEAGIHCGRWVPSLTPDGQAVDVSADVMVLPIVADDEQPLYPDDVREELYFSNRHFSNNRRFNCPGVLRGYYDHIRLVHEPSRMVVTLAAMPYFADITRLRTKAEMVLRARLHHKMLPDPPPIVRAYDQASGKVTDPITRLVGVLSEVLEGNIYPFVKVRIAAEQRTALRTCIENV